MRDVLARIRETDAAPDDETLTCGRRSERHARTTGGARGAARLARKPLSTGLSPRGESARGGRTWRDPDRMGHAAPAASTAHVVQSW